MDSHPNDKAESDSKENINNNDEQEQTSTSANHNNPNPTTGLVDSSDDKESLRQENASSKMLQISSCTKDMNERNPFISLRSDTSSLTLSRSPDNIPVSVPVIYEQLPMSSCYIPTSSSLTKEGVKLPTLLQLCVEQLNASSISLSAVTKMYQRPGRFGSCTNEMTLKSAGLATPDSLISAPPSYSFVLRQMDIRRRPRLVGTFIPSPSFVIQTPPPTYATAFDIYVDSPIPPPPRTYNYGFTSMPVVCPECGYTGMSLITSRVTICTHLCAATLCIFCCWICAPLPYILRSCKNVYHYCRNCRSFLGMYCPTSPENVY